jgi:hypothetical protein
VGEEGVGFGAFGGWGDGGENVGWGGGLFFDGFFLCFYWFDGKRVKFLRSLF